jgi:hypothetical protein
VRALTVLGGESFIEWVRGKLLEAAQADRELPAVCRLGGRPGVDAIRSAVDELFMDDQAKARRVGLYLCRRHTGLKLKEIGAACGVGESSVTQASRRVAEEMKENASVRNLLECLRGSLGCEKWVTLYQCTAHDHPASARQRSRSPVVKLL